MKTNNYITEIPKFMKKRGTKKLNDNPNNILQKKETNIPQKIKEEYQNLRNSIYSYFCLEDNTSRDYYFKGNDRRNNQQTLEQSIFRIVSEPMQPYMEELQKEIEEKGVQLTYSFPLKGKVGFVTVKKTRS